MYADIKKKIKSKSVQDFLFLLSIQGVNYIIPIILIPYLMKVLGASSYGIVGFSQSLIGYFLLFIDFGFNLSATKRIAINKGNSETLNRIFSATVIAKSLLLIISVILLFLVLEIKAFKFYKYGLLASIPTILGTTFTFVWLYQGLGKIKKISIFSILSRVIVLPLILFFVRNPSHYIYAILIQSAVYFFTAILCVIDIIKLKYVKLVSVKWRDVSCEFKESFPLFLSSASVTLYTRLFVIILGFIALPDVLGRYTAAEKIMRSVTLLFFTPLSQLFYPKIAQYSVRNIPGGVILLKKILILSLVVMLSIGIVIFITADLITQFLGSDYTGMEIFLKTFSIVPLFIVTGGVFGQMGLLALGDFRAKKKYKQSYYIAGVFSLCAVFIMANFFSVLGVALAVVLTELLVALLMSFHFFRYLRTLKNSKCI